MVTETLGALVRARKARAMKRSSRYDATRDYGKFQPVRKSGFVQHVLAVVIFALLLRTSEAAFINFENCLEPSYINSQPTRLQWVPKNFDVTFDTASSEHPMNISIYGNVTGQTTTAALPPPDSEEWGNSTFENGKIVDLSGNYTTLSPRFQVLTFNQQGPDRSRFCNSTINGTTCPIAPAFSANESNYWELPAFTLSHSWYSSFQFATLTATISILSGDPGATPIGCISANITPDLGTSLANAFTYVPAAILILVGLATVFAAIFSPWGSSDIFRFSSNYGRDEDLLRLVTPGFGDCLQYIQFIVLAGSLNLNYPGFYQPVVSQAAWSILAFKQSLVSGGDDYEAVKDGVYAVNGTYGLSRMRQYVGQSRDQDLWGVFAVWLLGLSVLIVILCQLGFFLRWAARTLSKTPEEDLQSKNLPFTVGNLIRLSFNYFLLPIITLSMFQMVVANRSPTSVVATAVILLVIILVSSAWIFWLIFTTRPRGILFDDMPTVLMYGPLYNTYSDDAAPFAFIPVLLTVIRGIAVGAIQPSGIAQLVMLAICEVLLILTLHAFRPFQAPTSMNAYHTFFASFRLAITLLSVTFVPSLGVTEPARGWLGYIILFLHALVLFFGFFLNSVQTIIEVAARLAGVGNESRGGLTRIFGRRQLAQRGHRNHRRNQRSSLTSQQAMLGAAHSRKSSDGRARSMSASSAILLQRNSPAFDQFSQGGDYSTIDGASPTPGTPGVGGAVSPFSHLAGAGSRRPTLTSKLEDPSDTFYRKPRQRRATNDLNLEEAGLDETWQDPVPVRTKYKDSPEQADQAQFGEASATRAAMRPAHLGMQREDSDTNLADRLRNTDYTVRESDFYYGVTRGPALSSQPSRRLKTGPADPTGPVASASGWLKGFLGGKRKDKGKGFEVVRSTRAPPQMMPLEEVASPSEQYHDIPQKDPDANVSGDGVLVERGDIGVAATSDRRISSESSPSGASDLEEEPASRGIPSLAPIEGVGGLDMPSRWGSQHTQRTQHTQPSRAASNAAQSLPNIPRKSSRRTQSVDKRFLADAAQLSPHNRNPSTSTSTSKSHLHPTDGTTIPRMPFGSSEPSPSPSPERSLKNSGSAESSLNQADNLYMGADNTVPLPTVQQLGGVIDRPASTGYVERHAAAERVQPGVFRENSHLGERAEVVDEGVGRGGSTASRKTGSSK